MSERSESIHELLDDISMSFTTERKAFLQSLFPLVTHVSPDDEEFDMDLFRDMIR